MSELNKSVPYLRATLKEAILDLNVRQDTVLRDVIRDSRCLEAILLLLDKVEALEGKTPPTPEPTLEPKFQDRSFIVAYAGETLCLPQDKHRAEQQGYEVIGTFQLEPGKNYLKLSKR